MGAPRHIVLWWPHWAVVAAEPGPDEPVAVWYAHRVLACTPAARTEGVRPGQRRREAQGRCPRLRWEPADFAAAARAFEPVVRVVTEMVPRLEVGDPGSLTFLARGPSRYFGGEESVARRLLAAVAAGSGVAPVGLDPTPGIGIADGRFAAELAARLSPRRDGLFLVDPGPESTRSFLAPHPVTALRDLAGVDPEVVDLWRRLGLRRLGDLAGLAGRDVVARFGRVGERAHRLVLGDDDRPPDERTPTVAGAVECEFEPPVAHSEAAVFRARQLADEVIGLLAGRGQICTRLVVVAETEHGERSERCWGRPSGFTVGDVVERVRWQLDGWAQHDLTAGVSLLRLDPVEVRRSEGVQPGLWGGRTQVDEWAQRAITRLVGLVGEQSVRVPAAHGGRRAHREVRWVSAVDAAEASAPSTAAAVEARLGVPWPGRVPGPAPSVVHEVALPTVVLDAAGVSPTVGGRGELSAPPASVDGVAVQAWAGPWPLDERWWSPDSHRSARLQIATVDGRLLLVEVQGGRWWKVAEHR